MAPGPITSWQIEGEKVEVVTDFLFLGSKITADSGYSYEIRRWLFCGRKAMTNLDSMLKTTDITLPTKVCLVKAMVFPLVTYDCEIWTVKKTEHQRIDAFELLCWRRLLKVHRTAGRSNQSILRKINLNIHWKDWCWIEAPVFWKSDTNSQLIGKDPDAGKVEGRRRGHQRMRWLDGITDQWLWTWANFGRWWGTWRPSVLQYMELQRVWHDWATEQLYI